MQSNVSLLPNMETQLIYTAHHLALPTVTKQEVVDYAETLWRSACVRAHVHVLPT